ncbi:hypothetical protein BGZ72_003402 [Mortierella alpina]|nr:hypothetical protein BGZ72_003402 [Mortierella alpina]
MIPPLPSTIVATCYIALIAILSCVQFHRSQTPLRLGAAVMAVFGLSISALSVVYTTDKLSLSVFWVYQFVAECIAVTWVITTIIHLGYAFYPLTRHQTLIWRTALGSVILYDVVAIAELSYYCYAVWGSHTLSKEATPVLWIYWVRQVVKVLACAVTIAYLFVPLVRHHNSTGLAMIADSNTLAVGTWYLSALGLTCLGYTSMFIYYMTKPTEVFSPQAQALDLCIRLTACPIFSLPPPRILIQYFQTKYGSSIRDDNPNTMIEDGITNDPRPRRPPMLVSQPTSFSSRRNSGFVFDPPSTYQARYRLSYQSHNTRGDRDLDRCKHSMDEEVNIGSTSSSSDTAAESSPRLKPLATERPDLPSDLDDAVLTSLAISAPPVDIPLTPISNQPMSIKAPSSTSASSPDQQELEETAKAARRISRRLTMEGRRDGLDFLNISGLMKWSAHTHDVLPTTATSSSSSSPAASPFALAHPFPLLPSHIPHNGSVEHSHDPTEARIGKLSTISDGSNTEDEDAVSELTSQQQFVAPSSSKKVQQYGHARTGVQDSISIRVDDDHQPPLSFGQGVDPTQLEPKTDLSRHRSAPPTSLMVKKLSMDNIRRKSRDALARLQEGGLGAALSIPAASGPLSPTILRSGRSSGAGHPILSEKANPREDLDNRTTPSLPQLPSFEGFITEHRAEHYTDEKPAAGDDGSRYTQEP